MIAIFDLDGTLTNNKHRQHFLKEKPKNWKAFKEACGEDKLNSDIAAIWHRFHLDYRFILTGRSEESKYDSATWLQHYGLDGYHGLYMRKSSDYRSDVIVKKELFEQLCLDFKNKMNVGFDTQTIIVFEDRQKVVDMWREMGLTCCQVAPGNF